ncbi:hypothetical protein MRB53_023016 [Persea americana]|uniref:Uncharacterized protein n=1 Tax=Persea americana TaxID=3435 RepID=A0ACC2L8S8_PERAE|nr:hypothetical protein MRB53_023016 [Persea americana]
MATTNRMLFPKIAPNGDRVGLLQFANDLLLFLRPNDRTLTNHNQLLSMFEEQAGQHINRTKSQLMFSKNASSRTIRATKDALHIQREVTSFNYLGTSLALKCNHRNTWLNTICRVQNRIAGCRGSNLSPAGRKILIKSVTTAIPIYWLGHHLIPGKVLKQINGDGSRIDAFKDRWISGQIDGSPLPRHPNPPPLLVSNLIRLDLHAHPSWNREAPQMWLDEDTVANILNIPLAGRDTACWKNENGGTCQTRSLYKHFQQPTIGPHFPWNTLWSLPMPSKHKIFLWKCLLNRLPLRGRLQRFIPSINPLCVLCHQESKNTYHLFGSYRATSTLWSSFHRTTHTLPPQTPVDSWFWNQNTSRQLVVGCLWWYVWKARNNIIFHNQPWHPLSVLRQPPPPNAYKLNVDGSFNPLTQTSRIGGVICDYRGVLIQAFASSTVANSALEAELIALLRGVSMCLELSNCKDMCLQEEEIQSPEDHRRETTLEEVDLSHLARLVEGTNWVIDILFGTKYGNRSIWSWA